MQLCLDSHVESLTSSNNCGSSCQHGSSACDLGVWLPIYREKNSSTQHNRGRQFCCCTMPHIAEPVLSSGRAGT